MLRYILTAHPKLGAMLSIGGTVSSFIAGALPILQFVGVASGIFIGWYTFFLQQKKQKNESDN